MEILSALWQVGVFAAVILFGTKLGIASGLAKLSKRNLAILSLGYGGGSASEGAKAYEILKEENTPATAKNSQLLAVFGVALVILIIALGYRSKNKDDYQLDNHNYEL